MHLTITDMPIVPLFLFKLSVSLALVWGFYQVVLRRMTFYGLNRWYLLGYTLISFFIPLINIGPMVADGPAGEPVVLQFIPAIGGMAHRAAVPVAVAASLSPWTILSWVFLFGAAGMLTRLAVRWISLVRLRRNAQPIEGLEIKVYQVDKPILPFSFGNAIYINQRLHTEKEWEDIILHEFVHVRQRHTIDILLAELVCIVNWYNPFAWLICYSIRQNLEFIADQEVLDKGVDRKGYQYHLLKVIGEPRYRLANNFNFSSLRKRILMMNRLRTARVHLLKLLFLLPLVMVLLVAFRDSGVKLFGAHGPVYVNAAGIAIDAHDRKPIEGVVVRDQESGLQTTTDAGGFYKIQIPVVRSSAKVHLDYIKPGYDTDTRVRSIPTITQTIGILDVGVLRRPKESSSIVFIVPGFLKAPVDPGYADAKAEMHRALKDNDDLNKYMKLQKDHPEIGLFYTTEDCRKEIVIYMDGTIERYGYPGTPGLDDLYKKYGQIDNYMATDHPERIPGYRVNAGYLARWAEIGQRAQKDWHPANTNARAIIFPGDSRVIAVPVSGKPQVYDMDNDDSRERPQFERLYGKLPDCVPGAENKPNESMLIDGKVVPSVSRVKDTAPVENRGPIKNLLMIGKRSSTDTAAPLYIVDGKTMPVGWDISAIPAAMIRDINVIAGKSAISAYGQAGRNGVVRVNSKDPGHDWSKEIGSRNNPKTIGMIIYPGGPDHRPLFVINGRAVPDDTLQHMNPDSIASIDVMKDTAFLNNPELMKKYGNRGKYGIVFIHMKSEGLPLYFIDGREIPADSVKKLDPNQFESVNVLKGEAAKATYGERGKNGVILITLKKASGMIVRPGGPNAVVVTAEDGSWYMKADSIRIEGSILSALR